MTALEKLFAAAKLVRENAHAPYSNFHVGAAILTDRGTVFAGCNVEIASYPEGWCAETTALGKMVAAGETAVHAVLVMGEPGKLTTPCGGCRQRLAEFAGPDVTVHVADPTGIRASYSLGELLPASFVLADPA